MTRSNSELSHRVYTVVSREGQDDFWLPIGAAFEHADRSGYNVVLQALPIDGKLVLRVPKNDDEQRSNSKAQSNSQPKNKPGTRAR